jgi:hypothetical protein
MIMFWRLYVFSQNICIDLQVYMTSKSRRITSSICVFVLHTVYVCTCRHTDTHKHINAHTYTHACICLYTHTHTQTNKSENCLQSLFLYTMNKPGPSSPRCLGWLWAYKASCSVGTRVFSLAVKQLGCQGVKLTTDLYLVPRWGMHGASIHLPCVVFS